MRARANIMAMLIVVGSCLCVAAAPFFGMETISPADVWPWSGANSAEFRIFWNMRVPRVMLAFLAGAGLAVSGTCFQSMFHNALATPFTLGVSSGAAFGAALYVWMGFAFGMGALSGITLFALTGALMAVSIVYGLTQLRRGFSSQMLLLAGVAVNFFFSSLILFIQYLSNDAHSMRIIRWLMGNVGTVGLEAVLSVLPFVLVGGSIAFWLTNELNLLLTGDDLALSRGVSVRRVKHWLFFGTSLMIGGIVAFCGPIGFVGMMCPHMCRLLVGADHRRLTPVSFIFGGAFLVVCDTLARIVIAPGEIPVGVVTALLGGPFFLWLLVRNDKEMGI